MKGLERCIQLDRDCASICITVAGFMSRDSEYANQICKVCAEICNACATECEKHNQMDHCKKCAEACRNCAEECRSMG